MLEEFGRADILVNNAGICQVGSIEHMEEEDWDRILDVNLKGVFLCSKAVMAIMKRQRSGKIINVGSVSGKTGGFAVGAHYAASKAAVLAPYGVNASRRHFVKAKVQVHQ